MDGEEEYGAEREESMSSSRKAIERKELG